MTRETAEETLDPRIRISAPLRCDGIGRLDCAEDLESGGRLAVRWLPLDANGDAAVRACGLLPSHPTLPRIRQIGHVGGSAFVAMDFPEGQLLSTMVGGGERLDVDLVIRVAAQLSDALAVVHAQQVVHGELSPDSVLLVPADRAYLWDMPLVIANRLSDRRGENRLMQNLVKTAPYLAPERARGDGASCEADVYSLGVLLCVAAGAPLPVATTTLGVVHQVANVSWAPRVPSLLPDPWRAMLTRMVSVDAALRPTAAQVAQVFAERPMPVALPTVPEFPAVQLPPALLAIADAAMKKGLSAEQDIPPAEPPRPALTLEAPVVDVVRIPSTEIEAIEAEPDPEPVPPAPPAIQLTESTCALSATTSGNRRRMRRRPTDGPRVWKDANGNVLQDGDTVTVIKDLKVRGASASLKVGTKVRNIRLVDGDHDIDCKIDGFGAMQLKSEYVPPSDRDTMEQTYPGRQVLWPVPGAVQGCQHRKPSQ
jgi:alkylphosphonate utilization operon protein PhnA